MQKASFADVKTTIIRWWLTFFYHFKFCELNFFLIMLFKNKSQARKQTGLSYLGSVNSSAKTVKGLKYGIDTFIVYLAAGTSSGRNVCPKATLGCLAACLVESGRVILDKAGRITAARIKKTNLFYENREFFIQWLSEEITSAKAAADRKGHKFCVRFNGTSDLSPKLLKLGDKYLLDIHSDVQFYDYTKVSNRFNLLKTFKNYHLTFSYSGENWMECESILESGNNVTVVFSGELPSHYMGYEVIDGDQSDYRPDDKSGVIVGLKFKKTKSFVKMSEQQKTKFFADNTFIVSD